MNDKEDKKSEGIPTNEVLTKEMLDDFIAVSKYLSKSAGIEHKFYN
jgi:hypothetical protein